MEWTVILGQTWRERESRVNGTDCSFRFVFQETMRTGSSACSMSRALQDIYQDWNSRSIQGTARLPMRGGIWRLCLGCWSCRTSLPTSRLPWWASEGSWWGTGSRLGGMSGCHRDEDQCQCQGGCSGSTPWRNQQTSVVSDSANKHRNKQRALTIP